ncbi:MAG: DUF29 domain-containing protein [Stellaceae bacterium]
MPDGPRYDDDFYAWTQHQAAVLRAMLAVDNRFDREHVAEEIEDLGKSERDAVRSQIRRVIEHFLKLAYSPAEQPRFDWMDSVVEARAVLGDKLTPTLGRDAEAMLAKLYDDGRERAELSLRSYGATEAAGRLPASCPYTLDQILLRGWYPNRDGETP